jgi:Holliday junction resolvasome RuvABC DNA-binding subunit
MSGGSYNYLCHSWDLDDLDKHESDLEDMADRLAALGYAQDAARETQALLEWWDSNDWSEDQVKEALAKYRGDQ